MESALSESTALSQKSEREYITLRDSIKGMTESWKQDTDRLREEMRKREEKLQAEAQRLGKMYSDLVNEIQKANDSKQTVKKLKEEDQKLSGDVEKYWTEQIQSMKQEVEKEARNSEQANKTAQYVWVPSKLDLTLFTNSSAQTLIRRTEKTAEIDAKCWPENKRRQSYPTSKVGPTAMMIPTFSTLLVPD